MTEYVLMGGKWVDPDPPVQVALYSGEREIYGIGYARQSSTVKNLYGRYRWHAGEAWGSVTHAAWYLNDTLLGVLPLGGVTIDVGDTVDLEWEPPTFEVKEFLP